MTAEVEQPYKDQNGKEIKEFAVLKVYHFKGTNEQGRGRKHYYMYKWVRLVEYSDNKKYWAAMHLTNGDLKNCYRLKAVANENRIIKGTEIVQQY